MKKQIKNKRYKYELIRACDSGVIYDVIKCTSFKHIFLCG